MRAYEFLFENATSGSTASGNVASVVNTLMTKNSQSFFGAPAKTEVTVIRRPTQATEIKEEEKGKKLKKAKDSN